MFLNHPRTPRQPVGALMCRVTPHHHLIVPPAGRGPPGLFVRGRAELERLEPAVRCSSSEETGLAVAENCLITTSSMFLPL